MLKLWFGIKRISQKMATKMGNRPPSHKFFLDSTILLWSNYLSLIKEISMKSLLLGLLLAGSALANSNDLTHRPASFAGPFGKAVFVDFTEATYQITYDLSKKEASVVANIRFNQIEEGHPVFDSVENPSSIILDGKKSTSAAVVKTPSQETTLRVLDDSVSVGAHTLTITVPLKSLVEFKDDGVRSAFWTSDLSIRQFLERYMPANLEYDQVKMTFFVTFLGQKNQQQIYTNGEMSIVNNNTVKISYPSYYNASSIFFHTVPVNSVDEVRYTLRSIDGRIIPVVIYAQKSMLGNAGNLEKFKNETNKVFQELESDYGAWPHPSIVVYNAGMGGMEYCGATITEFRALGHELFHSYFARGVMPANGNAGWLDEALASWRDGRYQSISNLNGSSGMSSHPYYTRTTDRAAYSFGERFMSFMDNKLKDKGGLKPFLRYMVDKRIFAPLFVEDFISEMSKFYGVNVEPEFKQYTFKNGFQKDNHVHVENPIHRKMTIEELQKLL